MIDHHAAHFRQKDAWAMPVVAETHDGRLRDINTRHARPENALAALAALGAGPVAEGSTAGGNGMICHEFKGETGTLSGRITVGGKDFVVAARGRPVTGFDRG